LASLIGRILPVVAESSDQLARAFHGHTIRLSEVAHLVTDAGDHGAGVGTAILFVIGHEAVSFVQENR
jgi:hypothetical protein